MSQPSVDLYLFPHSVDLVYYMWFLNNIRNVTTQWWFPKRRNLDLTSVNWELIESVGGLEGTVVLHNYYVTLFFK